MSSTWRRAVALCAGLAFITSSALAQGHMEVLRSKLYQTSRARLALARARGQQFFGVIIAAAPGTSARVVNDIRSAGGNILGWDESVDYVHAELPVGRVESIASRADVTTIDSDSQITTLMPPQTTLSPPPPVHRRTEKMLRPLTHPYLAGLAIGTVQLRKAHPTYDGRGVTIAVLDGTPDFLLPELQHARTADGQVIRKFADLRLAFDYRMDSAHQWVNMSRPVHALGGEFTVNGVHYSAPHDGDYRFGVVRYESESYYGYEFNTANTKMHYKKGDVLFAVLFDEATDTVYVDVQNNHSFASSKPLTDYATRQDYGEFPTSPTNNEVRRTVGFVVQTDKISHHVALLFGDAFHATGVAGTIAANRDDGGRIEGIAPEAQLLAMTEDGSSAGIIQAAIAAARHPNVDAIVLEIISALAYAVKDGRFTESVILERLTKRYNKPIFMPADNDFGMERVSEPCVQPDIVCVGAYESRESWAVNEGVATAEEDNLHEVSAFGPGGNGALAPTFLAPSGFISLSPADTYEAFYAQKKDVLDLPPGYTIFGGTSQATPCAAGAFAVLLSGAREAGLRITPQIFGKAASDTARYIENLPAYQQGNGLLQIPQALHAVGAMQRDESPRVSFEAPVHTVVSSLLRDPNRGAGYFEREGIIAGSRVVRNMKIIRRSGRRDIEAATIELRGNDGTFSTVSHVNLALNRAADVKLLVNPRTAGAHSALFIVHSAANGQVWGRTLLTVVAGEQLNARSGYTVTRRILVPQAGPRSLFVTVPAGTQALLMNMNVPRGKPIFSTWMPDSTDALNISNNILGNFVVHPGMGQAVIPNPQPGTWELEYIGFIDDGLRRNNGKVHPADPITLQVSALAYTAEFNKETIVARRRFAASSSITLSRQPAVRTTVRGVIVPGAQRVYDLSVPRQATGIAVTVHAGSVGTDVYLMECVHTCLLRSKATALDTNQYLYYDRPKPGRWKLVVDGYIASKHGTPFTVNAYILTGLNAFAQPHSVTMATFGTFGEDPDLYYNEMPGAGPIKRRAGLNPVIFSTQIVPQK